MICTNYTHTHTHTHRVADELFTFNELAVHLKKKKQSVTKLVTDAIPLGVSDWFQLAKDKAMSNLKPKNSGPDPEEPNTGELETMEPSQVCSYYL